MVKETPGFHRALLRSLQTGTDDAGAGTGSVYRPPPGAPRGLGTREQTREKYGSWTWTTAPLPSGHHAGQKREKLSPISLVLPGSSVGKKSAYNAGHTRDAGSIPMSGRSRGEGNGDPLPHSCLENSMDREA